MLLLLLLKDVGGGRLIESDLQAISPKSPAPQYNNNNNDLLEKDGGTKNCIYKDYQPIDRKKRKGKTIEVHLITHWLCVINSFNCKLKLKTK